MMIPEHEIFVHYIDHLGNNEAVTINEDGSYSIFLDPALSCEMQHEKYEHALRHIQNHDFEKENVQEKDERIHDLETELKITQTKIGTMKEFQNQSNHTKEENV